jgi:hypothetical protein
LFESSVSSALQELFFKERRRRQAGRPSVPANDPDKMKVLFGTVMALIGWCGFWLLLSMLIRAVGGYLCYC